MSAVCEICNPGYVLRIYQNASVSYLFQTICIFNIIVVSFITNCDIVYGVVKIYCFFYHVVQKNLVIFQFIGGYFWKCVIQLKKIINYIVCM